MLALPPRRRALAMADVLILILIAAVLAGMCLPALLKTRQAAGPVACTHRLRQILLALQAMNDECGKLPPLVGSYPSTKGHSQGTVFFYLLPYIEEDMLYRNAFRKELPGYAVWVNDTYGASVRSFVCPADLSNPREAPFQDWLATGSYAANAQVFGVPRGTAGDVVSLEGEPRIPDTFADGMSNTVVLTERYQLCGEDANGWGYHGTYYWTPMFAYYSQARFQVQPAAAECDPTLPQSPHAGGIQAGLMDGSVRFVAASVSPTTWWQACTPAGGEALGSDW